MYPITTPASSPANPRLSVHWAGLTLFVIGPWGALHDRRGPRAPAHRLVVRCRGGRLQTSATFKSPQNAHTGRAWRTECMRLSSVPRPSVSSLSPALYPTPPYTPHAPHALAPISNICSPENAEATLEIGPDARGRAGNRPGCARSRQRSAWMRVDASGWRTVSDE